MNCEQCKELLVAYVEDLLTESQKQSVELHLQNCPLCRAELTQLIGLRDRLAANGKVLAQSDLENKVLNQIVREQSSKLREVSKSNKQIQLWRIIMKSRITKLVAAAAIVVAVIAGLHFYTGSFDVTTPAFGVSDVMAAMKNARWLHTTFQWVGNINNVSSDTFKQWEKAECWYSIDPYRMIIIEQSGRIELTTSNSIKVYDPKNNTITVTSPRYPEENPPASMPEVYLRAISALEKRGAKIQYSDSTYGNRSVKIINVDFSTDEGFREKITIIADAETHLAKKMTVYQASAGESGTLSMVFDYPSSGPEDIYEAGAARDAKVIMKDS